MPNDTVIILTFPKFNPEAPSSLRKSYVISPSKLICTAIQNADPGLRCSSKAQGPQNDTLTVSGAFPGGIAPGKVIQIQIDSLYNPLSLLAREIPTEFAVLSSRDGAAYAIEQGQTQFTATEPTTISGVEITSSTTTVQEYAEYKIKFQPDVEIQAGAYVTIQFPRGELQPDFVFDNDLQSMSTIGGLFGGRQDNAPFNVDGANLKLQLKQGTSRYSTASPATITVGLLKNPRYQGLFGPFIITVFDKSKEMIARVADGFYQTTAGDIIKVQASLKDYNVESSTQLTVEFAPVHYLPKDSKIRIVLPVDLAITCPNNFDYNSEMLVRPLDISCTVDSARSLNVIEINRPFIVDYFYDDTKRIRIVFASIKTPRSARDLSTLSITTLTARNQAVDVYQSTAVQFAIVAQPFLTQSVAVDEIQTSTESVFTFSLTLATSLASDCIIQVELPPEVTLPENPTQNLTVIPMTRNLNTIATTLTLTQATQPIIMQISNFLTGAAVLPSGSLITFNLQYLTTPRSTLSSSSFKIYSKSQKTGRAINYVESELFVTMTKGRTINSAAVSSASPVVGDLASHTIAFPTPITLFQTDQIMIIYPQETFPPVYGYCAGGLGFSSQQDCTVIQNIVKTSSLVFQTEQGSQAASVLQKNTPVNFTVDDSQNPKTGRTTGAYQIFLKDQGGYTVGEMSDPNNANLKLTMTSPAIITKASVKAIDRRQLALTAYELTWTSEMPYPKDAFLILEIDSKVIGPEAHPNRGAPNCSSNLQLVIQCTFLTDDKIKITGMFVEDLVAKTYISFLITNFYVGIYEPVVTKSWKLTVFTPDEYFIDAASSGLNFTFSCSVPCETCYDGGDQPQPQQCKSCNALSGLKILYDRKCYDVCPGGTYYDDTTYGCKKCNEMCLDCVQTNGNECTSCNPFGKFPFLDGTVCKAECPFGTYGNYTLGKCVACEAPCQSCRKGPTDCNTCDIKSEQKYFQNGNCQTKCDSGYTVPLGFEDFICQRCDSNCLTCTGSLTYCTSCSPFGYSYLSLLDNKCEQSCPQLTSITSPEALSCLPCSHQCLYCRGQVDQCAACKPGTYLYGSTCVKECKDVHVNGQTYGFVKSIEDGSLPKCVRCKAPCNQCQEKEDKCLNCLDKKFMFGYKCYSKCPDKYEPRNGVCTLEGIFCPFGYELNELQNGCLLKAQICLDKDILNYDKTKCIPQPKFLLPFPLLILAVLGTVVIVKDKRDHSQARFYPNMISLLSILETIGIIGIVALSNDYGIYPSYSLSLCALLFLYGMNVFFAIVYQKTIKLDSAFKYWEQEFETTTMGIFCVGFLINFKVYRMFYSRFWDRKDFNAVFTDELIFYRTLVFTTCFFIVTGSVPIIIACIFGLSYISFGYQLQMFCLEMILIECLILILMCIELFKIRRHFFQKSFYKINPYQGKHFMLKSQQPEDSLDFGKKESSSETIGILQKLVQRVDLRDAGKRVDYSTVKEIRDLHEEEFRRHQMRRCISFKEVREYCDENDEFHKMLEEEDDSDYQCNWISEPNSPRSKQMLLNPNFKFRMNELSKVYHMRDQYDNCYHEGKPLHMFEYKSCQMVSRTIQTNVLELLGVDDLMPQFSKSIDMIKRRDLLNQKIEEESVNEQEDLTEAARLLSKNFLGKVLNNFEGFQEKKKRKRLAPQRMRQLPKFKIQQIVGNFEIDEAGNYIIISNGKDSSGKLILEDKEGLRVNRRGYLTNKEGQIIMRDGTIVFKPEEVDEDDEIPAPFCYSKNKETLASANLFGPNNINYDPDSIVPEQDEEDEAVEREYQAFKSGAQMDERSDRSDKGQMPPSKLMKKLAPRKLDFYNPNDEDYISQVSKPFKPIPKKKLVQPSSQISSNYGKSQATSSVPQKQQTKMLKARQQPLAPKADTEGVPRIIDQDFFTRGHLDDAYMNNIEVDDDMKDRKNLLVSQKFADISMTGQNLNSDIQVEMANRPQSGAVSRKVKSKKYAQLLRPEQKNLLLADKPEKTTRKADKQVFHVNNSGFLKNRDKELKIVEGIEKFQALLARYPLKPRKHKSAKTLVNQNLNKVYGKITQLQFARNIKAQEHQGGIVGGLVASQQFMVGQLSKQNTLDKGSIGGNNSQFSQLSLPPSHNNPVVTSNFQLQSKLFKGQSGQIQQADPKIQGLTQIYTLEQRQNKNRTSNASQKPNDGSFSIISGGLGQATDVLFSANADKYINSFGVQKTVRNTVNPGSERFSQQIEEQLEENAHFQRHIEVQGVINKSKKKQKGKNNYFSDNQKMEQMINSDEEEFVQMIKQPNQDQQKLKEDSDLKLF